MSSQITYYDFLQDIQPFSQLPSDELERTALHLNPTHYHRKMTLFVQDTTIITHVILVHQGNLEYVLSEEGRVVNSFRIGEKDIYGALSLLFNSGLSIGTVRSLDDVVLLHLEKDFFLELCSRHKDFSKYFADQYSRKVLHSPYIDYLSKRSRSPQDISGPFFLSKPVGSILSANFCICLPETSIRDAARKITTSDQDAVMVLDSHNKPLGIVTDHDLRDKVIIQGISAESAVQEIMSSPLISIQDQTLVYEAVLLMMDKRIKQLAVENETGICGLISEQEIFLAQGLSPIYIMHQIQTAPDVQQLKSIHSKKPYLIKSLIDSGAKAQHLTGLITSMSDATLERLIEFALHELGPPPVPFAFVLFGSEGRREQTLKTDQDNAIIYADENPDQKSEVQAYFLALGTKVCDWLNDAGQSFCEFNIMAKNPKWCQPLRVWKGYFQSWIGTDDPDTLLKGNIFFDLKLGYGEHQLVDELRSSLFENLNQWPGFLRSMAINTTSYRPPLDLFGQFVLHNKDQRRNILDLKSPMRLVVDFARIYALKLQMVEAHTVTRLKALLESGTFEQEVIRDLIEAYEWLLVFRLSHQARMAVDSSKEPDNLLSPKELTHIDRQTLKQAFKTIKTIQGLLRRDFFLFGPLSP
jgi:CBS domain-containing protein